MTSIQSRILTFAVGVPGISAIILFFPQGNHLLFTLFTVVFIYLGSRETANLFRQKGYSVPFFVPFSAALFPFLTWTGMHFGISGRLIEYYTVLVLMFILMREIQNSEDRDFSSSLLRIGASFTTFFYPAFFSIYAVRITGLEHPGLRLFTFLILVFANDTAAYIFGSLFGRKSRRLFKASPNKSLVGFGSGFIVTIIIAALIHYLLPVIFTSIYVACAAGVSVGLTAIIGDLAESALKRSAVIKDSGDVIPGRGGILDSIDSIIFSAPLYFLILNYFS
ncbi:phosphatidate cytidylyltransferase [Marispirochaeta sp.]|jgi:phosphatidate cytidylyltransferase|uniref:phosphatidate cytidylyltransferase n=1 Tax=Marispirochaeta sp. TaxID=2038653 RepID=UPI0029C8EAE9|nr:phosphatidate cytidylyltransferase [Marispirochaeta sp.]